MEQVMELLKSMATSLGVAVEYLWATLVRQQYAEGVTDIVWVAIEVVILIFIAIYAPKLTKRADDEYKRLGVDRKVNGTGFDGSTWVPSFQEDRWNALRKGIPIGACVIGIILLIGIGIDVTTGIQRLINPDYFALKEILNVIQSG